MAHQFKVKPLCQLCAVLGAESKLQARDLFTSLPIGSVELLLQDPKIKSAPKIRFDTTMSYDEFNSRSVFCLKLKLIRYIIEMCQYESQAAVSENHHSVQLVGDSSMV